jgi:hypothetical protein
MTSADLMRFFIILGLGVVSFIAFLVAGTLIGLMWLESWHCGNCARYPAGIYILGVLGVLLLATIGGEAGEASKHWEKHAPAVQKRAKETFAWMRKNWPILVAIVLSVAATYAVMNWWTIVNWWYCLF